MHTIKTKINKQMISQRIDSTVLKKYQKTKSRYNRLFKNKVDTAKYIEELLKEITLDMDSAINLAKKTNYTT
jgi:hypothetical protein